jgi:hypothetical protein
MKKHQPEISTWLVEGVGDSGKNGYTQDMNDMENSVFEIVGSCNAVVVLFGVVGSSKGQIRNIKWRDSEGRIS